MTKVTTVSGRTSIAAFECEGQQKAWQKQKQLQKLCVIIKSVVILSRERRSFVLFLTSWHTWSPVVCPKRQNDKSQAFVGQRSIDKKIERKRAYDTREKVLLRASGIRRIFSSVISVKNLHNTT